MTVPRIKGKSNMDLQALLQFVGKEVFVKYYRYFKDKNIKPKDIVSIITENHTNKSKKSRLGHARMIFNRNWQKEALKNIADSPRISEDIKNAANNLLNEENGHSGHSVILANNLQELSDENEQAILSKYYRKEKTKQQIKKELSNYSPSEPKTIKVKGTVYKRENSVIAKIKILRDFKCQICGTAIVKKDGSKYVEAAHITTKPDGGNESPDNILLLCPNHHKEFDLGDKSIIYRSKTSITIKMNGKEYTLKLS